METRNVLKNITPAIAVMIVGVLGAYLVYDNYFSGGEQAAVVSTFEPAAGDDASGGEAVATSEGAAMSAEGHVDGHVDEPVATVDAQGRKIDENGCLIDELGVTIKDETTEEPDDCVKGTLTGPDAVEVDTPVEDAATPAQ